MPVSSIKAWKWVEKQKAVPVSSAHPDHQDSFPDVSYPVVYQPRGIDEFVLIHGLSRVWTQGFHSSFYLLSKPRHNWSKNTKEQSVPTPAPPSTICSCRSHCSLLLIITGSSETVLFEFKTFVIGRHQNCNSDLGPLLTPPLFGLFPLDSEKFTPTF